jgi:ABC-type molybdate transport system permease subunit
MILRLMVWYAIFASAVTVVFGVSFAYLYHTRTKGGWHDSEMGRHLMAFVLAPTVVLALGLIPIHQIWWMFIQLAAFTTVPLVYLQRIRIFLKVQHEEDQYDSSQDH